MQALTITGHTTIASAVADDALANLTANLDTLKLHSAVGQTKLGDPKMVLENLTSMVLPFSKTLTCLSLSNCILPSSSEGNMVWSPGFFARLPCLSVLHMAGMHVGAKADFDLNGCIGLQELTCSNCGLQSLDVTACSKLKILDCSNNHLRDSLSVSTCKHLQTLHCQRNQLSALQLPVGDALTDLCCFTNKLQSLNLSHCASLENLQCSNNNLSAVILPDSVHMKELHLTANALYARNLEVSGGFSSTVSSLKCHTNDLNMLKSPNLLARLKKACIYGAAFEELSGFQDLLELTCDAGPLGSINLNGCGAAAVKLNCNSSCHNLPIHGRSSVWALFVSGLSGPPDLIGFTGLRHLSYCIQCLEGVLDLSVCCKTLQTVRVLDSSRNGTSTLSQIILTGCDKLEELICEGFPTLIELDLTPCTKLVSFKCVGSSIQSLDMSSCLLLTKVDIFKSNLLKSIQLPTSSNNNMQILTEQCPMLVRPTSVTRV